MTDSPTFFTATKLPPVGTYVIIGNLSSKILRYSPNGVQVTVQQWQAGEAVEQTYNVDVLSPQPVPVPELTEDRVDDVLERLRTATAEMKAANLRQWEIKIVRQTVDQGDQDANERELAALLNDGWKIVSMKSSRVKAKHASMLVVIYLKRKTSLLNPSAAQEEARADADAVENVPSVEVPEIVTPAAKTSTAVDVLVKPVTQKKPLDQVTFMEALASGLYSADELKEIGDRQAMHSGREEFVTRMMARQEAYPMMNLPVLPSPAGIPA